MHGAKVVVPRSRLCELRQFTTFSSLGELGDGENPQSAEHVASNEQTFFVAPVCKGVAYSPSEVDG